MSKKSGEAVPIFCDYAARWLDSYARVELKRSTFRSYEQLLRLHIIPQFGHLKLSDIKRKNIKMFLSKLSCQTKTIGQSTSPKFSRDTLRLIVCAPRTVLNAAVENGDLESNPASRVAKFAKREPRAQQAVAMTRQEIESFLAAVREVCPDWYPFFLTALRAGLRKGELIALKWGDIQFGDSERDSNRYILVQRSYHMGAFTTTKNKKSRRGI
jgi:integrase